MQVEVPLFKVVQKPLLPISGSWVDATPFVLFFAILAGAAYALGRGRKVQLLRRTSQVLSSFIFIIFIHRCLCILRGWVFALKIVGRNDVIAFGYLCMFVLIAALTLVFGRVFCGWACPLGFFGEILGWTAQRRARLSRGRLTAGYMVLSGTMLLVVWMAYLVRPGTQYFSENVAAVWGGWLLLLLLFALPLERRDRGLKRVKYVSLGLWLLLSVIGVFVTSPWCTLFGDEVDYSSMVALVSVVLASAVVSMSWCRYLCPMGAALGLVARHSPSQLTNRKPCQGCGACREMCPMGALREGGIDHASCIYCGRCVGQCGFEWHNEDETQEES